MTSHDFYPSLSETVTISKTPLHLDAAKGLLLSLGPTCGTLSQKLDNREAFTVSKLNTFLFQQSWALLWIHIKWGALQILYTTLLYYYYYLLLLLLLLHLSVKMAAPVVKAWKPVAKPSPMNWTFGLRIPALSYLLWLLYSSTNSQSGSRKSRHNQWCWVGWRRKWVNYIEYRFYL